MSLAGLDPSSSLAPMLAAPVRTGFVRWIGLRPARRAAMVEVEAAQLVGGQGILGDRYKTSHNGARQVTLIEVEGLAAIASFLGLDRAPAIQLRRNIVIEGVNLLALKGRRFHLGEALLEYSGECHPCSRMEEAFGPGGYHAVRGRGGITARVIGGGTVRLCDELRQAK